MQYPQYLDLACEALVSPNTCILSMLDVTNHTHGFYCKGYCYVVPGPSPRIDPSVAISVLSSHQRLAGAGAVISGLLPDRRAKGCSSNCSAYVPWAVQRQHRSSVDSHSYFEWPAPVLGKKHCSILYDPFSLLPFAHKEHPLCCLVLVHVLGKLT